MKLLSGIIITLLLCVMFASLFHMSTGMDMSGGMSYCPFMSQEETLCPMDLTDHLMAWQTIFTVIVPTLVLLLSVAVLTVLVTWSLLARRSNTIPILYRQILQKRYTYAYKLLQELFSNGILHPKLF